MANRFSNQFVASIAKGVTILGARVTFGSSGAPTLVTSTGSVAKAPASQGVLSITRNATGNYTFVFGSVGNVNLLDIYAQRLYHGASFQTIATTTTLPTAPIMAVTASSVGVVGTASLTVQLYSAAGSAADPASGETGFFLFIFGNSTAY